MREKGRRTRGTGAVYQRRDGETWCYTVDLGWSGGRRRRKTVTAKTMRDLRPKMARLDREVAAGIDRDGTTTVQGWLTYWLDEIAPARVKERTLAGYRGYVSTWLIPQLGQHRLDKLEPSHIRALHRTMADAGKAPATVRQAHAILSRALTVAVRDGKMLRNPAEAAELPRNTTKGSHGKLTLPEAYQVLTHLRTCETSVRSRWAVAILCGLRQGEALGLDWQDVDLDRRVLWVHQAEQRINGRLVITGVKSKSSVRWVPIPTEAHAALTAHTDRTGLVWGPRDNKADWREWQDVLAGAGVHRATVHAARATCASILAEAGVPSKVIAEILGHATPRITEAAYIHGDARMHRDALDGAERLLALE